MSAPPLANQRAIIDRRALAARIEHLRDGIVATLPKSLGVRLGFNSLDGD